MKFSVNFDGLKVSDPLTMIEPHATYSRVRFKGKLYSVAQKNCHIYRSFVTLMRANPETLLGLGFLLKAYKSRNLLENLAWKAYGATTFNP